MRTFAFDYDLTWSVDPFAFEAWVAILLFRGHTCLIVTGRSERDKLTLGVEIPHGIRVIYCDRRPKRKVLAEHGFIGNIIFVDDMPECCGEAKLLGGEL